jgi:hypothetical protein
MTTPSGDGRLAMSPEPVSDEAMRSLAAEGCNARELAAYTGHEPLHAAQIVYSARLCPAGHRP